MFITQSINHWCCGILFWILMTILMLSQMSCSPLFLVNTLSAENDAIIISHERYGKEQRQQLDIYTPERIVAGSPVVIFFYGGSWKRGEKENYAFVGHSISSKGFITVIPDYRLYPEVTFPGFVEDGANVLAWVGKYVEQAQNGVVVMGHSAGAHISALLALDQSYLEAAGQNFGMISGMIGLAGPYGFNPMKYRSTKPIFEGVEVIEKAMPVNFACLRKTPLLLMHGLDDSIVIPDNSRELKRRAYACGGNVKYIELDDIGHFSILLGLSDSFLAEDVILSSIEVFLQSLSQQPG